VKKDAEDYVTVLQDIGDCTWTSPRAPRFGACVSSNTVIPLDRFDSLFRTPIAIAFTGAVKYYIQSRSIPELGAKNGVIILKISKADVSTSECAVPLSGGGHS
jgi:hypothetical protein